MKEQQQHSETDSQETDELDSFAKTSSKSITYYKIEKMAQEFKTHRSVLDFETAFVQKF